MAKKLRLVKCGFGREDVYDKCKKRGYIDIDGEYQGEGEQIGFFSECHYGSDEEELIWKAKEIVNQITTDPMERSMAELMLDYGYTEVEVAEIILSEWKLKSMNESLARVKWFMRKIEAWKRNKQGHKIDA
jgi:hypothetical protein